MAEKEFITICGLSAVRALAEHSPGLIERLFFSENTARHFSGACRYLAQQRKTYRMVANDELRKIADTTHHQGAAAVIVPPPAEPLQKISGHTLCLHDVENPHNVGAIMRTAAFFGVERIIVSRRSHAAAMTQAAWRVAEGGLTHVALSVYENADDFFSWAAGEYRVLAAVRPEAKTNRTLGEFLRDKRESPLIVCLGNEEDGLPADFISRCAGRFTIQGSGKVESLNVSVAAALCLSEFSGKGHSL